MSGPQARPFKGRLGFDANNDKVVNLADPTDSQDGVNKRWFVANNSVQAFDPTRTYVAGFVVEYSDRLYKAKTGIGAGVFNLTQWTEIHAFGRWLRVTNAYTAEPGDNLYVSTQAGSITITLPNPAEDGDIVTVLDEGYAKTNPIVVSAADTINNVVGPYSINSQDVIQFIYLGGTWRVSREEKTTYNYVTAAGTLVPNSYNLVKANPVKTLLLPPTPVAGQWVTVVDSDNQFSQYYNTISGNGKTIDGATTLVLNRFGAQATFVYTGTEWKAVTNQTERRFASEGVAPLVCQTSTIDLDATNKSVTLPATAVTGDWVEYIVTESQPFGIGSITVNTPAGKTFDFNGGDGNLVTAYQIRRSGRVMFVLKGTKWSVTDLGAMRQYGQSQLTEGVLRRNSFNILLGTPDKTFYLPPASSIQQGEIITVWVNVSVGRVKISVNDTVNGTEFIDGLTDVTYTAADNMKFVTFIFQGDIGSGVYWIRVDHGAAHLDKYQNLADLPNKGTSRTNLDVFSKGESDNRFLPLHGTADAALQAANSDKLDNLHSADFIQAKNPSTTAVDANTTTEARFTTNLNTPDATMWQVVMFTDNATGAKSQIALNITTSNIAHRVYTGAAWTAWTRLDANANAATASKLFTARTIALSGDASGSATFDGSANSTISVNSVIASRFKPVVSTTDTASSYANMYTKVATVTITQAYSDVVCSYIGIGHKTGSGAFGGIGQFELKIAVRQLAAMGSAPTIRVSCFDNLSYEFGYVLVQNDATSTIVDIYAKTTLPSVIIDLNEISRSVNGVGSDITYFSSQSFTTIPSGYVAGVSNLRYGDTYHPLADKWTTPRTISFTGGLNGSVVLDGSADVSLNTTINTGATQFEISNVNGLQSALDGKLSNTATAADSYKLGGSVSGDYSKSIASTNTGENPNITVTPLILTNHVNTPDGGISYWYVETKFYETRTTTSNRVQFATQYNGSVKTYTRQYYGGTWSSWTEFNKEYVDQKYSDISNQTLIAIWTGI